MTGFATGAVHVLTIPEAYDTFRLAVKHVEGVDTEID